MSYDFSIIIPYYNKRYELDLVLMALACQEYNIERFEIIIVDDGSEQNIEDIIVYYQSTYSLVINYIRRPHTGNRGQLRNIGAEQSKAARLIFLDSDMVAESSMLKAFAAALDESSKTISLGCRNLLFPYDKEKIDRYTVKDHFEIFKSLPSKKDERTTYNILEQEYGLHYTGGWQICFSSCLCMQKQEFVTAGFFDEIFSRNWGAEDVELGYRLHRNGCYFKMNYQVMCHHLYHGSNVRANILSLRKNYKLFMQKHRHWEVELFTREYMIWAKDTIAIEQKILAHRHLIEALPNSQEAVALLPDNTLLVGITDPVLLNSERVTAAFIPHSPLIHPKIENIIGYLSGSSDKQFTFALVSARYADVDEGLFKVLTDELERITKNYIVVAKEENLLQVLMTGKLPAKKKKERHLLFSLSNDNFQDLDKNNMLNLSIAMHALGIKTGIQHAFDPLNFIDINNGYAPFSNKQKLDTLVRLKAHSYNFFGEDVPHIMDYMAVINLQRSMEKKVLWYNKLFLNKSDFYDVIIKEAADIFFRRPGDMDEFSSFARKHYIPVGVDKEKISRIKNASVMKNDAFTFLFTDQIVDDYSNLDMLTAVFHRLFANDNSVRLKIITSGPFYPSKQHLESLRADSHRHLLEKFYELQRLSNRDYLEMLKHRYSAAENILFMEKDLTDEEYSDEIYKCDCFLHLNSKMFIFPYVLESIAFGKRPVIPADNRYAGYFTEQEYFGVQTDRISALFGAYPLWCLKTDMLPPESYKGINQIEETSLEETLLYITRHRNEIMIDPITVSRFLDEFDWKSIGEKVRQAIL